MLLINGSNREKNNYKILKELKQENDTLISLSHKKINYCLGCNSCKKKLENYCIQEDDMKDIYMKLKENDKIIDVGTGAGFPGIPIAITTKTNITLLDSLNKRVKFLNEVKENLNLNNVETIHGRAEEVAKMNKYREKFNIATSRAVAPMNVLLEYLLPFVKVGGLCLCMKGPNYKDEMTNINNVENILGGTIENIENIKLLDGKIERNIIVFKKEKNTPSRYPRKAGTPSKEPLK